MADHGNYREELHLDDHPHAFDRREPNYWFVGGFALAAVVLFGVTMAAIQLYYYIMRDQMVYERVLAPESQELKAIRTREDSILHSYKVVDQTKGTVRIPIERAMELTIQEAAAGRTAYNTNPYAIKTPQQQGAPAAGASANTGAPGPAPSEKKPAPVSQ